MQSKPTFGCANCRLLPQCKRNTGFWTFRGSKSLTWNCAPLGEDEAQIQLVDAALADFLTPKDSGQHVPTEPEIRNFLRGFIDGLLKPNLSAQIERAVSVSYSGGQTTIVLKTDKATAAAISRHVDKAAAEDGVSKAQALENLIYNRTSAKVVINTYRTGEDPSRLFIPSAGWCDLGGLST